MHVYLSIIIKKTGYHFETVIVGAIGAIGGKKRKGENDATIFSLKFRK